MRGKPPPSNATNNPAPPSSQKSNGTMPTCPHCGHNHGMVLDSRLNDLGTIRRRRICNGCNQRFTTYEASDSVMRAVARFSRIRADLADIKATVQAALDNFNSFDETDGH